MLMFKVGDLVCKKSPILNNALGIITFAFKGERYIILWQDNKPHSTYSNRTHKGSSLKLVARVKELEECI